MFITFEGIDGTGKTTVAKAIAERLKGLPIHLTSEPTKTPLGDMIRKEILSGSHPVHTTFLFLADRVTHSQDIHNRLLKGDIVICDRYHDSTIAYQGVLLSEIMGKEKAFSYLEEMWEFFLKPDATILFVSDPVKAIHRIGTRGPRTSYERMEFLAQVQEAFIALEAKEKDRFVRVYADIPLDNLIKEVEAKVKHILTK